MTRRWVWFLACSILGLAAVLFALAIPAHLRAVDSAVLKRAGRGTPGVVDHAFKQVRDRQLGPARLLLQAAQSQRLSGREKLEASVNDLAMRYPRLRVWGRPEPVFDAIFRTEQDSVVIGATTLDEYRKHIERDAALAALECRRNDRKIQLRRHFQHHPGGKPGFDRLNRLLRLENRLSAPLPTRRAERQRTGSGI